MRKYYSVNPLAILHYLLFFVLLHLLLFFVYIGIKHGWLPFYPTTSLPRDPSSKIFFLLAKIFSICLPILLLIVCIRLKEFRILFVPFLVVLLLQIGSEFAIARFYYFSMIYLCSLPTILFRLWQLKLGHKLFRVSSLGKRVKCIGLATIYLNAGLWIGILIRLSLRLRQLLVLPFSF